MKKSKKPLRIFINLLLLLAIFALIGGIVSILMPLLVQKGKEVAVPNLMGLTPEKAESLLVKSGLKKGEIRTVPSAEVPVNRVCGQYPRAGRRVKIGREVDLEISAGVSKVRIPNLEGLPLANAITALERSGFVVARVESIRTATVPAGRVVTLFPPAGTEVRRGTEVVISVSTKTGMFPMPNLVGLNIETARGIIASHGLILGGIKPASSNEPLGTVLFQYPEEGMAVCSGDTVSLIVVQDSNTSNQKR
ncbi:MAG: PASTA domain-containing protein [candidate division WOR-3 bacterium]|jgi:serine/threonine-protein kinase|nr:PASTA domain-containing protein [candidate division WOR-3 bacterium]MCR4423355.1 PASTA domain-containing protein [candidate division WOR-3 bacterium]MDH7518694.1 PASTA domain-containing protein [bacterium]